MIPGHGPSCDICTPDVHFWLTCPKCSHEWDEPPTPMTFACPNCGTDVEVTLEELQAWERDILGIRDENDQIT